MSKCLRWAVCALAVAVLPSTVQAGWVIEWEGTPIRKTGRQESLSSKSYIASDKRLVEQEHIQTIYDYGSGTFTLLNPKKKYIWSGTIEEYVTRSTERRNKALRKKFGGNKDKDASKPKAIDKESLPPVVIERKPEEKDIAGYTALRYDVLVDGQLFQEIWVAEGLNLESDLDPEKLVKYQQERSRGYIGASAAPHNALYHSKDYLDLLRKGFALQTTTYHLAGGYEQRAKSVRAADIDGARFKAPEDYRRVRLTDIFTPDE